MTMGSDREQRTQTVFLVDDDASTLCVLELMLREAGHVTSAFDSALDFLERLAPDVPGCVLLDLHMPEMDGLAVQAALEQAGSTLPIVFLSGVAGVPDAVAAMKHGAVDFLVKPTTGAALREAVARALERDRAARARRRAHEAWRARFERLAPQERRVAGLVAQGLPSKHIAAALGIAEQTTRVYRSRLMRKLGVVSVVELVHRVEQLAGRAESHDLAAEATPAP
jgi:FixJ family two-component response regulator